MLGSRPRRTAERVVVLESAVHVVERRRVVDVDVVVLRERQVLEERPRRAAIERAIQPAVVADEKMARILRIDPDDVIVDVHVPLPERPECLPGIV